MQAVEQELLDIYNNLLENGLIKEAVEIRTKAIHKLFFETDNCEENELLKIFLMMERSDLQDRCFDRESIFHSCEFSGINTLLCVKLGYKNLFINILEFYEEESYADKYLGNWLHQIKRYIIVKYFDPNTNPQRQLRSALDYFSFRFNVTGVQEELSNRKAFSFYENHVLPQYMNVDFPIDNENHVHLTRISLLQTLFINSWETGETDEVRYFLMKVIEILKEDDPSYRMFKFLEKEILLDATWSVTQREV